MGTKKRRPLKIVLKDAQKYVLGNSTIGVSNHPDGPETGMCIMESVALITGDKWSDKPVCVSPAITDMMIGVNDNVEDEARQGLKEVVPEIIGTHWNDVGVTDAEHRAEAQRERLIADKEYELNAAHTKGDQKAYVKLAVEIAREAAAIKADPDEVRKQVLEMGFQPATHASKVTDYVSYDAKEGYPSKQEAQ